MFLVLLCNRRHRCHLNLLLPAAGALPLPTSCPGKRPASHPCTPKCGHVCLSHFHRVSGFLDIVGATPPTFVGWDYSLLSVPSDPRRLCNACNHRVPGGAGNPHGGIFSASSGQTTRRAHLNLSKRWASQRTWMMWFCLFYISVVVTSEKRFPKNRKRALISRKRR